MSKFNKLKLRNIGFLNSPQRRVASYGNSGSDDSDGSNDNHGSIDDNGSYGNNYGSSEGNYGSSDGSSLTGGFGFDEEDCMPQEVYYALLENGTTVSGVYVCELGWTIPEVVDTEKSGCSWDDGGSEAWGSSGYDPWFGSSLSGSSLYGSSLYGSSTSRGGGGTQTTDDKEVKLTDKAKALIKKNKNLNQEQVDKLEKELAKMLTDCRYAAIYDALASRQYPFSSVEIDDTLPHPVATDTNNALFFLNTEAIRSQSLSHEMYHLFQNSHNSYNSKSRLAYEFEQAFFMDIMYFQRYAVNGEIPKDVAYKTQYAFITNNAYNDDDTNYRKMLAKITQNGIPESILEEDINTALGYFKDYSSYSEESQESISNYKYNALTEGLKLAKEKCPK